VHTGMKLISQQCYLKYPKEQMTLQMHSARSSSDAEGLHDTTTNMKYRTLNACNRGMTFKDTQVLCRPYTSITSC